MDPISYPVCEKCHKYSKNAWSHFCISSRSALHQSSGDAFRANTIYIITSEQIWQLEYIYDNWLFCNISRLLETKDDSWNDWEMQNVPDRVSSYHFRFRNASRAWMSKRTLSLDVSIIRQNCNLVTKTCFCWGFVECIRNALATCFRNVSRGHERMCEWMENDRGLTVKPDSCFLMSAEVIWPHRLPFASRDQLLSGWHISWF